MKPALPPTEERHERSAGLDLLTTQQLVELLVGDQRAAVEAVASVAAQIASAADAIAARLRRGGRLHYVGAGSSGRIATLDAAEMPPTFGTPEDLVHAHVAGGNAALVQAIEGAEDDAQAGTGAIARCVTEADAVLGISAGGAAPFVVAAVAQAAASGALTIGVTSVEASPLAKAAQIAIVIPTGPEILTGSTRLKAGTAQKIALNAISTAVMVRLGKVHDNLMVDVVATNAKLRERAIRLVRELAGVDEARARELLALARGRVKVAVVIERCNLDALQAESLLIARDDLLRAVLEVP